MQHRGGLSRGLRLRHYRGDARSDRCRKKFPLTGDKADECVIKADKSWLERINCYALSEIAMLPQLQPGKETPCQIPLPTKHAGYHDDLCV
jgi:hypothetical protein